MGTAVTTPVRVLVVDDSEVFRGVARELLEATVGFRWIGEACCGEDGVRQAERLAPDLVLMDVRMPGIGGVEAARRIAGQASPPAVVLITATDPDNAMADATAPVLCKQQLSVALLARLLRNDRCRPEGDDA